MKIKVHGKGMECIVALCDSELIGRVFKGGGRVLDLKRHASFYNGERVGENGAIAALAKASSVNLVGKQSVAAGKKAGVISGKEVVIIGGVPHAQAYRI